MKDTQIALTNTREGEDVFLSYLHTVRLKALKEKGKNRYPSNWSLLVVVPVEHSLLSLSNPILESSKM